MKWEDISFHASWTKAFTTEVTVNKVQVISEQDCSDKPYTTDFMNFTLSAAESYCPTAVRFKGAQLNFMTWKAAITPA